ncbi:MAG: hypothetical protein H6797_04190 [Candidatus Nomurabacteria bacterium]|nr:MAG: hypothetical protein H6797_04190 [Candidatus Nomurabacteria bacterium]
MTEVNFQKCSKDPETCDVIHDLIELDTFYEIASDMDEHYQEPRKIVCGLFNACVNGTCPGQAPELLEHFNREITNELRERE